jgi:hypothetical protein
MSTRLKTIPKKNRKIRKNILKIPNKPLTPKPQRKKTTFNIYDNQEKINESNLSRRFTRFNINNENDNDQVISENIPKEDDNKTEKIDVEKKYGFTRRELNKLAYNYYKALPNNNPRSALNSDMKKKSKKITEDVNEWSYNVNTMDLKGYDDGSENKLEKIERENENKEDIEDFKKPRKYNKQNINSQKNQEKKQLLSDWNNARKLYNAKYNKSLYSSDHWKNFKASNNKRNLRMNIDFVNSLL